MDAAAGAPVVMLHQAQLVGDAQLIPCPLPLFGLLACLFVFFFCEGSQLGLVGKLQMPRFSLENVDSSTSALPAGLDQF